jgi:hypothetical protein
MKSGYLYVLVHPSDPNLYKIGVTIRKPEERLAQHNSQFDKYAGQVVKETGQKWEIKEVIVVPDPYLAEKVFWSATPISLMPGGAAIEVGRMEWAWVQAGLNAAKKAGVRSPPVPRTTSVRNREWMLTQLEGTGISIVGRYRGLIRGTDFRCEKGHEFTESAGVVANHKACPLCGPDYRAPWRRAASTRS